MSDYLYIFLCFMAFLALRNMVTYRIRTQQIEVVSELSKALINGGKYLEWYVPYNEFNNGPSYEAIMFNPFKWTRESVYGPITQDAAIADQEKKA